MFALNFKTAGVVPSGSGGSSGGGSSTNPTIIDSAAIAVESVFNAQTYTGSGTYQEIATHVSLGTFPTMTTQLFSSNNNDGDNPLPPAYDAAGNCYVVVTCYDQNNNYILQTVLFKFNNAGVAQWDFEIKVNAEDAVCGAFCCDPAGNTYLQLSDNQFDGGILVKYDTDGVLQWQIQLLSPLVAPPTSQWINYSTLTFANNVVTLAASSSISGGYIPVCQFDTSGNLLWQTQIIIPDTTSYTYPVCAVDAAGDTYVVVSYTTTDSSPAPQVGLLTKLDTAGNLLWATQFYLSGADSFYIQSIAIDTNNNINVNGAPYYGDGQTLWLGQFSSSGTLNWQRTLTLALTNIQPGGLVTDADNNIYVPMIYAPPCVILKYNSAGVLQWQYAVDMVGVSANATLVFLAMDPAGKLVVAEYFDEFGNVALFSIPLTDPAFLTGGTIFSDSAGDFTTTPLTLTTTSPGLLVGPVTLVTSISNTIITTSLSSQSGGTRGGLIWIKDRLLSSEVGADYFLNDTVQGLDYWLQSDTNDEAQQITDGSEIIQLGGNGFFLGSDSLGMTNVSGENYIAWTFARQPKFFDIVEYVGNGTTQTIPHNLQCAVGLMIVKCIGEGNWAVWHKDFQQGYSYLDLPYGSTTVSSQNDPSGNYFGDNATTVLPTSTQFTVGNGVNPSDPTTADRMVNQEGQSYIAYLFAHDPSPTGVIQCGSYITDPVIQIEVSLGWEPQFILGAISDTVNPTMWEICDSARGFTYASNNPVLQAATPYGDEGAGPWLPLEGGFLSQPTTTPNTGLYNDAIVVPSNVLYLAIRRGPMTFPTTGSSVYVVASPVEWGSYNFALDTSTTNSDLFIIHDTAINQPNLWYTKSYGGDGFLDSTTNNYNTSNDYVHYPYYNGSWVYLTSPPDYFDGSTEMGWCFSRNPGVFDLTLFNNNQLDQTATITHELGVVPELIIIKNLQTSTGIASPIVDWYIYHKTLGIDQALDFSDAAVTTGTVFASIPTSASLVVQNLAVEGSADLFVAYLFATLAGVSFVGSYTGNGTLQTINCGFTNGARFVMIKRTDSSGGWAVIDTYRGINPFGVVTPLAIMGSTASDLSTQNVFSPDPTGFIVQEDADEFSINATGGTYIVLALA